MVHPPSPNNDQRHPPQISAVIVVLSLLLCALEAAMILSDFGILPWRNLRALTLQYGAFWPGLLANWQPNFSAQPWVMFFSYSFLHSNWSHLLSNVLALILVGPPLVEQLGRRKFLVLWILSALGGAVAFALLSLSGFTPMVGASGSIFGLVGAIVILRYGRWKTLWKVVLITVALVVLNFVMLVFEQGLLAWQTHLGGYVVGVALSILFRKR